MKNPEFDLENFSSTSLARCDSPEGFNAADKAPTYFAASLAEEAGEVVQILKKLERGFNVREKTKTINKLIKKTDDPFVHAEIRNLGDFALKDIWQRNHQEALKKELADVFTYIALINAKYCEDSSDFFEVVKSKFNQVSKEMECEQFKIK